MVTMLFHIKNPRPIVIKQMLKKYQVFDGPLCNVSLFNIICFFVYRNQIQTTL